MLPGGLYNPARKGTMITPDSTYEWRRKGEHVSSTVGIRYNRQEPMIGLWHLVRLLPNTANWDV